MPNQLRQMIYEQGVDLDANPWIAALWWVGPSSCYNVGSCCCTTFFEFSFLQLPAIPMRANAHRIMESAKRDIRLIAEVAHKSNKLMLYSNAVSRACCRGWDWKRTLGRCFHTNSRSWEKTITVAADVGYFRVITCLLPICILETLSTNMDWCDSAAVSKIC